MLLLLLHMYNSSQVSSHPCPGYAGSHASPKPQNQGEYAAGLLTAGGCGAASAPATHVERVAERAGVHSRGPAPSGLRGAASGSNRVWVLSERHREVR
jgi:hypothetical protein